jgi:hypothetical protein
MRQTNIHDSMVYATSMKTYVIDIKQNAFIVMYYKLQVASITFQ